MLLCVAVQTCNIRRDNARVIPLYFTVHLNATFKERIAFEVNDVYRGSGVVLHLKSSHSVP